MWWRPFEVETDFSAYVFKIFSAILKTKICRDTSEQLLLCRRRFKKINSFCITSKYGPAGIYLLQVNNRNTRTRCEICSKLTIKTSEHISHLVLVFLLLTLNMKLPAGIRQSKETLEKNLIRILEKPHVSMLLYILRYE